MICTFCTGKLSPLSCSKDFHLCRTCHIIFNSSYKPLEYGDEYFLSDYKEQYGRTYEEDFDSIYKLSTRRMQKILSLFNKQNQLSRETTLLDVGSALGFFLKCAQDYGISKCLGLELSTYAANYSSKKFSHRVINNSFDDADLSHSFDIITAWFFIEHSRDPVEVLQRLFSKLNSKGVLAFSVPSYYGPLYYFNRQVWVDTHPVDHSMDFTPQGIKTVLKGIGFTKVQVQASGIHPERVMSEKSSLFPLFKKLYRVYSKFTAFSDTIEVYAVK